MANWKALTWSETVQTGKPQARHVLTTLCLKCNDDFRVFSDAERLAGFCELSTRRLSDSRDYLEKHGFITVIRRLRPNGSEAKPITLLNVPGAPHLSGTPVVLDYGGKYLYPRLPQELHDAGVRWVAAGEDGRVHPSHTQPVDNSVESGDQHDESSGWQHDELSGCVTRDDGVDPPENQHDELSGWQHDNSSTHGVDETSTPSHSPFEAIPSVRPEAGEDEPVDGQTEDGSNEDRATALMREERAHAHLERLGPWRSQLDQIHAALIVLLAEASEQQVRGLLLGKLSEAKRSITYVIDGLTSHAAEVHHVTPVPSRAEKQQAKPEAGQQRQAQAARRETPEELMQELGGTGAFVPSRFRG